MNFPASVACAAPTATSANCQEFKVCTNGITVNEDCVLSKTDTEEAKVKCSRNTVSTFTNITN